MKQRSFYLYHYQKITGINWGEIRLKLGITNLVRPAGSTERLRFLKFSPSFYIFFTQPICIWSGPQANTPFLGPFEETRKLPDPFTCEKPTRYSSHADQTLKLSRSLCKCMVVSIYILTGKPHFIKTK